MSIKERIRFIRRKIAARRLVFSLGLAIFAALVLTGVSLSIYKIGGYYRYDLSRPGYEKERTEISTTPTDVTYDTTSPLNKQAVDTFLQQLDVRRKNLEDYNTYGMGGLSDEDLQLTSQAPAPQ
jgi:hypothetical protein